MISGAVYTFTAARDIVVGDMPELAAVAANLGVAHPPGYPLLTLMGHLFSAVPLGPVPFRINFASGSVPSNKDLPMMML